MIDKLRLHLTGVNQGKTVDWPPFKFVNGVAELVAQREDLEKYAHYAAISYQAYPEGHPMIKTINDQVAADLAAETEKQDGQRDLQPQGGSNPDGSGAVHGGVQSDGAGTGAEGAAAGSGDAGAGVGQSGGLPDGNGQQAQLNPQPELPKDPQPELPKTPTEPVAQVNEKLRRAVLGLDPSDDSHWIASGKPALAAVEKAYGSTGLTRADVEAVAPGFVRPTA